MKGVEAADRAVAENRSKQSNVPLVPAPPTFDVLPCRSPWRQPLALRERRTLLGAKRWPAWPGLPGLPGLIFQPAGLA